MRHPEESTARQQQAGAARRRDSARLLERRTTLAAIAAEAGVSLPTVSKVVNGRPDVAPATRARVEQLLDQHQYSRTGMRRHRRSGLIDVVFAGLDSPWAVEILRGIEDWGAQHETAVAVSSVRHGNARPANSTTPPERNVPAGNTPNAARHVNVFPLPDSPTSPTASPRAIRNETHGRLEDERRRRLLLLLLVMMMMMVMTFR